MSDNPVWHDDISILDLHDRPFYALKRNDVLTIGELCQKTEAELLRMANMGQKGVDEIKARLDEHGLSLREE